LGSFFSPLEADFSTYNLENIESKEAARINKEEKD
jgi:hypothetical protein